MSRLYEISRRAALHLSLPAAAALWAVSCRPAAQPGRPPSAPSTAPGAPAAAGQYKEAPQLAALVKEGKLPPVEQRLPKEPLVLKPVERIGQYGGQWRTALLGRADTAWLLRTVGYENLVRWDPEWKSIIPNIARKFEANPDGTEFTFYLREGMKWSDGQPFTAEDIVFWFDDIVSNEELTPVFPRWLTAGGKRGKVVKVDEYTVKFQFAAPNGLFLQNLATPTGSWTFAPAHYLKRWHKKYAGEGVAAEVEKRRALVEEEMKRRGLQGDYQTFFAIMADPWFNPERPVVFAWKATRGLGEGTRLTFERNPYYWKVDPDGNQLPYLDGVVYDLHESVETMVLKALNGEIDMQDRHIAQDRNKSVFFDNQQKGNYRFFETIPSSMNTAVIALNLAHKDPVLRQIFQDKRFRMALSHAINRKEAIDLIYVGQGEPWQPAPRKESIFYNERLAKQYLEYNPQLANRLLDEMGLTRKDSRGMRLRPDGKPIYIAFEVVATQTDRVDYLRLVKQYWAAIGIDMDIKAEDRSIFYTRKEANEHDAGIWGGDGGMEVILEPRWYFPFSYESIYATAWARWFITNGRDGEEPPEPTKQQMELYRQLSATGDEGKQVELMKQILDIAANQFYAIGLSLPVSGYGIVRNDFHNVPKTMIGAWLYPNPGPVNPPQFFSTRR
jgi:peptide/nickel transport system substrate-binding protein